MDIYGDRSKLSKPIISWIGFSGNIFTGNHGGFPFRSWGFPVPSVPTKPIH